MRNIKIKAASVLLAVSILLTGCDKKGNTASGQTSNNGTSLGQDNKIEFENNLGIWGVLPEIPVTDASAFTYKYDSELGGMVVTDYLKESPKVRLPDTLEGEPVVKVDFSRLDKQLTEIIMPDSVKSFEFSDEIKSSLQYANHPKGTKTVGGFGSALMSVYIPEGVTAIDENAFYNCSNLTHISIPDSLMEIGYNAFTGCNNLNAITYKEKTYDAKDNIYDLYEAVYLNAGDIRIEGGVLKEVSSEVTKVSIPEGVTIIDNAFNDCTSLMSVTLPNTVHTIDNSAFSACKKVKVTYKGKSYNYEQLADLYDAINYGESGTNSDVSSNYSVKKSGYVPAFDLNSDGVYMVNLDTDIVVASKNPDRKLYPASTTKIMTCLVALENVNDFNVYVDCPYECFNEFSWVGEYYNPNFIGASNAAIEPLQTNITYKDCMYALMLRSGCEAANIIAYNVSGSIEAFVELMNETAKKIGCQNTHFSNAHGLFEEDNYTTAYDLYLITRYAIDNYPEFMKICNTFEYDMPANENNPGGYTIYSSNKMIRTDSEYYDVGVKGIKTGTISDYVLKRNGEWDEDNPIDGFCSLVTYCERDGYSYLIVTLQAPYYNERGEAGNTHYEDHKQLYDWAYNEFELKQVIGRNEQIMMVDVKMGKNTNEVGAITTEEFYTLLPKSLDVTAIQKVIPTVNPILAPVNSGKYIGNLELRFDGETIAIIPLVTENGVVRRAANNASN